MPAIEKRQSKKMARCRNVGWTMTHRQHLHPLSPSSPMVSCALSALLMLGALKQAIAQNAQEDRLRNDWAFLSRYREENARVGLPKPGERRVVFYGNSITEAWAKYFPAQFAGKPYIGRGISGQTTPQLLVRFRQDVIDLKPAVVVILAGTNDIAGNTGPSTLEMIEGNIASMVELARANRIAIVLSSVLPASDYPCKKGLEPPPKH